MCWYCDRTNGRVSRTREQASLFRGQKRLDQSGGLGEPFARCLTNARNANALGEIERCSAIGILRLQVRAVLGEEFHEGSEASFCRTMQRGLVRHRRRARHLTGSPATAG